MYEIVRGRTSLIHTLFKNPSPASFRVLSENESDGKLWWRMHILLCMIL